MEACFYFAWFLLLILLTDMSVNSDSKVSSFYETVFERSHLNLSIFGGFWLSCRWLDSDLQNGACLAVKSASSSQCFQLEFFIFL